MEQISYINILMENWHKAKKAIPEDLLYKIVNLSKSGITLKLPQSVINDIIKVLSND